MWIRAALPLLLGMTASAQTLEIPPVTIDRGAANIFRITFKPGAGKPITALQWDLIYRDCFRIEPSGVVSGGAAETAGKSVICVRKPPDGPNFRLACILAGGVQTLSEGVLAIVRFEAPQNTPKSEGPVDLENVVGVSPALEPVPMKGTRTSITIR